MTSKHVLFMPFLIIFGFSGFSQGNNNTENRNIRDEYFIVINDSSTEFGAANYVNNLNDMRELEHNIISVGGEVLNKYYLVFTGIHARLSEQALAQLETIATIQKIQPNEFAYLVDDAQTSPQAVQSWGLDRIDQRDLPLNNTYTAPANNGVAHAYIIDSGVRSTHREFVGRIGNGTSTITDPSIEDCLGHGTHVAGTTLGSTVGVSTNTILHPVRVFGCSGTTTFDAILKGLEWVIANHKKPAVANMSLGANTSADLLDIAVRNTVASGVVVVVAAGNSSQDACTATPAREPSAITVAASDINDNRASYSNFGSCVDVIAPGSAITSAYYTADNSYASLSGTSMASPHACGAAAVVSALHPTWTPKQVADEIILKTTSGKINDARGTPNKLLYVSGFSTNNLVVNAGVDIVQSLPNNKVDLLGTASSPSGSVTSLSWQQISGPTSLHNRLARSAEARLTLYDLTVGTYVFMFTASDSNGQTASDSITVTINPQNQAPEAHKGPQKSDTIAAPVVNAGPDLSVSASDASFTLNGSATDGSDQLYFVWFQLSGPGIASMSDCLSATTSVTNFAVGAYTFRLFAINGTGKSVGYDDVVVTVQ